MSTLQNFTTPIISLAAAFALSFVSISNTVSTPGSAAPAAATSSSLAHVA